uniref:Uncharacterized protein n=1 Tax=Tanacetum cinerariifolium TaxID=118510 RepID=A0A699JPS4_TANCI|nr:hypothetical protein [Tanacetum cinerariifolium]
MIFDDKQLYGLPTHKEKYDVSFHKKKVFVNMKRIGKGFSEHDSGNIVETQTKTTSNEPSSLGTSSGDGPKRQDTMEDTFADTRHKEVVEVVTTAKMLIDTVVDIAQVTTAIADIPVTIVVTIVTIDLNITAEFTKTNVEVTQPSKRKRVMIQEPEETTTTKTAYSQQPQVHEKGKRKANLIEEPEMPKKRKHQISANNELAKMQADSDEKDRLIRERDQKEQEGNDALINT